MSVSICDATENDIPDILDIWQSGASFANGIDPTRTQVNYLSRLAAETIRSQKSTARIWIAKAEHVVVGWQSLLPCRPNPFFHDLHVESSTYTRRRSGVPDLGYQLLLFATQYANTSPIEMILGFVMHDNVPSLRMMTKCGFKKAGALPLASESAASSREIWFYDATPTRRDA